MILATTKVADFDQFLQIFSTRGAEKRKEYGCRGSRVFRDPDDANRVLGVFDWDLDGWQKFLGDPAVPGIFAAAGLQGQPVVIETTAEYES